MAQLAAAIQVEGDVVRSGDCGATVQKLFAGVIILHVCRVFVISSHLHIITARRNYKDLRCESIEIYQIQWHHIKVG